MSKSTPSLLALLGLVAFAGYQNRARISEMLDDARQKHPATADGSDPQGSMLSGITDMFRSGTVGSTLSSGLGSLVERFKAAGHGQTAESWVADGPNRPLGDQDLEHVIGDETLSELIHKTGLSRSDLLSRLSAALPATVNQFTPQGRIPSEAEAQTLA